MNLPRLSLLASLRLWTFVTVIGFCATAAAQMRPETLVTGLENPWGVAFLPGGSLSREFGAGTGEATISKKHSFVPKSAQMIVDRVLIFV